MDCLEAFASGLYSEIFTVLISLINRFVLSFSHSVLPLSLLYSVEKLCFGFRVNMYYSKNVSDLTRHLISFQFLVTGTKKTNILLQFSGVLNKDVGLFESKGCDC